MDKLEKKKAFVSWTGGKDSNLALYKAKREGYDVTGLVTFIPEDADFKAHPIKVIKEQAQALALPHFLAKVKKPYEKSYERELARIKKEYQITHLVTGDVDYIAGHNSNFMQERCKNIGFVIYNPLWQMSRENIWKELLSNEFKVIISFIKGLVLDADWIGKFIHKDNFEELKELSIKKKFDLCGENGEFHTIVLDAPDYRYEIKLVDYAIINRNEYSYLKLK